MARVSKLRRPVAICRRGNNLNGGVFSYDKNPHLPQNCDKKMLCWKSSEGAREKREEGDRRSGLSVTIKICRRRNLLRGIKLKNLTIEGKKRKRKRVVMCKQLFSASQHESQLANTPQDKRKFSRQKLTHAYYAFASYVRREGHLYEVFLVSAKTRLF